MYWSVALTKPQQEHTAADNLHRQGYDTYLPKYCIKVKAETKVKLLFPRYIFIQINDKWHSINGTRGVSRLILTTENRPAVVPDDVIQEIKSREDKGLVRLPSQERFKPGEQVSLDVQGKTVYGIVEGMSDSDRVRILVEILGRKVPIWVDEGTLRAAAIGSINE